MPSMDKDLHGLGEHLLRYPRAYKARSLRLVGQICKQKELNRGSLVDG